MPQLDNLVAMLHLTPCPMIFLALPLVKVKKSKREQCILYIKVI